MIKRDLSERTQSWVTSLRHGDHLLRVTVFEELSASSCEEEFLARVLDAMIAVAKESIMRTEQIRSLQQAYALVGDAE